MAYRNVASLIARTIDDTEFRAFVQMIHDNLALMGIVQTADTGQINPATVTYPAGANNTPAGGEIWRFADSFQGTNPVFFKIEYGRGSSSTTYSLWMQVGSGSNGSGTLTGNLSTRIQAGQTASDADLFLHLFSGDTDRALIALSFFSSLGSAASRVCFLSIEREVNALGARIAGGALISWFGTTGSANARQEYWIGATGGAGVEITLGILAPRFGTLTSGADIGVLPQYHAANAFKPAGLNQLGYNHQSMAVNEQVIIPVYGVDHTYYTLGGNFAGEVGSSATRIYRGEGAGHINISLLARYDA